ncbi:hypothetical protein [Streptomyces sp. Adlamb9]|uniref:hypothetical protein n=1 Tax=Streptomyces sp. Adlamb9 TaxID=3400629 RepID=UPI003F1A4032
MDDALDLLRALMATKLLAKAERMGNDAKPWRRLVFARPDVPHGLVGKAAYSFCVLEHLHRSLRRRDVFAKDGDRWGDPRAKLLAGGTVE